MADTPRTQSELLTAFADTPVSNITAQESRDLIISGAIGIDSGGWTALPFTLVFTADTDDPTFVATVTGEDLTSIVGVGMRLKLTQTTAKYFIVTAIEFTGGDTLITLYGGTDYNLANAAITFPYFSSHKAPLGFPLDPGKWSVVVNNSSTYSSDTPNDADIWYDGPPIVIPIGSWRVFYSVELKLFSDTDQLVGLSGETTLTHTSGSETDNSTTRVVQAQTITSSQPPDYVNNVTISMSGEGLVNVAAKTTYLVAFRSTYGLSNGIYLGASYLNNQIRAVCNYL